MEYIFRKQKKITIIKILINKLNTSFPNNNKNLFMKYYNIFLNKLFP